MQSALPVEDARSYIGELLASGVSGKVFGNYSSKESEYLRHVLIIKINH
jgi:hypothetical protein